MKVSNTDNTAFQSKIKVISPKFFKYQSNKMRLNPGCEIIDFWNIIPHFNKKKFCGYRKNIDLGFTTDVRTCTAGIIANHGEPAPLFMHLGNTSANVKHVSFIKDFFQGTNAILVGSKDTFSYSRQLFDKLKNAALNKGLPLTIMQGLAKEWQAHLAYVSKEDTLYLCVNNAREQLNYVKNMEQLQKTFRKIEISPTDTVEFLNRFQERLLRIKTLL